MLTVRLAREGEARQLDRRTRGQAARIVDDQVIAIGLGRPVPVNSLRVQPAFADRWRRMSSRRLRTRLPAAPRLHRGCSWRPRTGGRAHSWPGSRKPAPAASGAPPADPRSAGAGWMAPAALRTAEPGRYRLAWQRQPGPAPGQLRAGSAPANGPRCSGSTNASMVARPSKASLQ